MEMQLTSRNNTKLVLCHQSTLSTTPHPSGFSYDCAKSDIISDINNLIMIHTGGSNELLIVSFIVYRFLCVSDGCWLDKSRKLDEGVHGAAGLVLRLMGPAEAGKVNVSSECAWWTCACQDDGRS